MSSLPPGSSVSVRAVVVRSLVRVSLRTRLRNWWRRRRLRGEFAPGLSYAELLEDFEREVDYALVFGPRPLLVDRLAPYSIATPSVLAARARVARIRSYAAGERRER